jgi:hypothetical protein
MMVWQRAEVEKLLEALRKSEDQIEALNRDMDGVGRSERERADAVKARADDERRYEENNIRRKSPFNLPSTTPPPFKLHPRKSQPRLILPVCDATCRAKEALLEELGGARHQHRVLLQEVWNMLLNFNAALDFYLADLLASAAVEVGRKTRFNLA